MRNLLINLFTIILMIVSAFSIYDIFTSLYFVFTYEKFDVRSSGILFGKALFLVLCILIYVFIKKLKVKNN